MRTLTLFLVQTLILLSTAAQTISGYVFDTQNQPIVGVYVINASSNSHTHSDVNGRFSALRCDLGDSLRFSHISHAEKIIIVKNYDEQRVKLEQQEFMLDAYAIKPQLDALNIMADVSLKTNPVRSTQELFRKVPGLFIGQHAGGGKAEQLFLRGFDVDHGTDVSISVDGMPVNMVSHAHGQGYADAHFIIPELIEKISFGKGPYYAAQGNFNTAGYLDFQLKDRLATSEIKLEGGQFGAQRFFGAFDLIKNDKQSAYLAMENIYSDGPFESPQNFGRSNVLGSFNARTALGNEIGIHASHFTSKWDASGQIPTRAVANGSISRFGAIDDTEGGETSRSNVQLEYKKLIDDERYVLAKAYYSAYDFELFSNFTFFLEDSINGDRIRQSENRSIIGASAEYTQSLYSQNANGLFKVGASLRADNIEDNELSRIKNRKELLQHIQFGDIQERNTAVYSNLTLNYGRWTFNPAIRLDYFQFRYLDNLQENYETTSKQAAQLSPKLNILYNHAEDLQLYVKTGRGFHSNDARTVAGSEALPILTAAYGTDLGFIWKPSSTLIINAAYWHLYLEQEFVYVGDAGIVEAGGSTKRNGIDLGFRYQPTARLFINGDVNYNHAQTLKVDEDRNRIPLAPEFTAVLGLNYNQAKGLIGGIHGRHLSDRPANEDNSIVAEGYTIIDANLAYQWQHLTAGFSVENLLNTAWNETQFATESRLYNEQTSTEEIHFTPGTPRFIKATLSYRF